MITKIILNVEDGESERISYKVGEPVSDGAFVISIEPNDWTWFTVKFSDDRDTIEIPLHSVAFLRRAV